MLDVNANRSATKYSRTEMLARVLWSIVSIGFRYSPRPCFAWRRFLLRMMGAKIGKNVNVYPSTRIYYPWMCEVGDSSAISEDVLVYSLGRVVIGRRVTVSHQAHLCAGTHDYSRPDFPLLRPEIRIGDDAWICADAFVGPGIEVGAGAVVGARAAAFADVPPWSIVQGNPAVVVKQRLIKQPAIAPSTESWRTS